MSMSGDSAQGSDNRGPTNPRLLTLRAGDKFIFYKNVTQSCCKEVTIENIDRLSSMPLELSTFWCVGYINEMTKLCITSYVDDVNNIFIPNTER